MLVIVPLSQSQCPLRLLFSSWFLRVTFLFSLKALGPKQCGLHGKKVLRDPYNSTNLGGKALRAFRYGWQFGFRIANSTNLRDVSIY